MSHLILVETKEDSPTSREPSAAQQTLRLYEAPYCFYCAQVRKAAEELGIALELVDIRSHPQARRLLIAELGRGTVPVLEIRSAGSVQWLPESRDIIKFLRALTE